MVHSSEEKVLLYQFRDTSHIESIKQALSSLHIPMQILPTEAWAQKVGYLLNLDGFHEQVVPEDDFVFPHEVMLLHNIKNKRLDQVLQTFHMMKVPVVRYKAVVTSFNTLWTLRRLCETMQKEQAALAEQEKMKIHESERN